jgi:hypothetical protein
MQKKYPKNVNIVSDFLNDFRGVSKVYRQGFFKICFDKYLHCSKVFKSFGFELSRILDQFYNYNVI